MYRETRKFHASPTITDSTEPRGEGSRSRYRRDPFLLSLEWEKFLKYTKLVRDFPYKSVKTTCKIGLIPLQCESKW